MVSVKVKFRCSTTSSKEGLIYYQIIKNRVIRQIKTDYRIFEDEWNEKNGVIILSNNRNSHLHTIKDRIKCDIKRLESIISHLENKRIRYSADDIVSSYRDQANGQYLFNFMCDIIVQLKQMGKYRTAETYRSALNSFMLFRENEDLLLGEINSDMMLMYEASLLNKGITKNSTSFYMRILRAVYNKAVEKELIEQRSPFKHVYTGIDKTVKRAITLKAIKQIKNLDLSFNKSADFSRDMFLFSFYTRGMSFVDMAYLKKKDLSNGKLTYRRHKTGQQLFIKWEKCMQEIVDKYNIVDNDYLLPIIKIPNVNERKQYENSLRLVNNKLKDIAAIIHLQMPLSTYVARHTWASIAKSKNIPISVISEGMGHDSEMTTQIYLSSLDTSAVDKANKLVLKELNNI